MLEQIDRVVLEFFGNLQLPVLNEIVIFISSLGNGGILWIALAALLICFKSTRRAGFTVGAALIIGLIVCNLTLKPLVARPRPFDQYELDLLIKAPADWSFPSGHTTSSFGAAVSVGLNLKGKWWLTLIPACLIALSRLYLQVHFLTDVLVGAIIGVAAAFLAAVIINFVYGKCKNDPR